MSFAGPWSHARDAVQILARYTGTIQDRLYRAAIEVSVILDQDMPPEMLADHLEIMDFLSDVKGPFDVNLGKFKATIAQLDDEQIAFITGKIVDFEENMYEFVD